LKFVIKNKQTDSYLSNFKPPIVAGTVISGGGFTDGYVRHIPMLIDTGAKHTLMSKRWMKRILQRIKDESGQALTPVGESRTQGVYGGEVVSPIYILPYLCVGNMRFEKVAVVASESDNFDCLIGRSILHCCTFVYDAISDEMSFDFTDSIPLPRQKVVGVDTFASVGLFAENS